MKADCPADRWFVAGRLNWAFGSHKNSNFLVTLLCVVTLAGCAIRPGPEVLSTTAKPVPGAKPVGIYVATTRQRASAQSNLFTDARAQALNFAEFKISIPPNHKSGNIEWPDGSYDPHTAFVTMDQTVLERTAFEQMLSPRRSANRPGVGVFVHGYNTNFQEALFRMAQMTADANVDGIPILFSWPSEATVGGYVADKDAVTASRDQLVELLTMLAHNPNLGQITVIGHSMGGWLTAEALRQLRLTGKNDVIKRLRVMLAAPDIDVDVFRSQMAVIGPLSPPMTILVSRDDVALSVSRLIAGERQRVGALDVSDPKVEEATRHANVQVVDISSLEASDNFKHDRFVALAAYYPKLTMEANTQPDFRRAGAYVFDAVSGGLSLPASGAE
jgi:esterase/lipase superfamily enzyme